MSYELKMRTNVGFPHEPAWVNFTYLSELKLNDKKYVCKSAAFNGHNLVCWTAGTDTIEALFRIKGMNSREGVELAPSNYKQYPNWVFKAPMSIGGDRTTYSFEGPDKIGSMAFVSAIVDGDHKLCMEYGPLKFDVTIASNASFIGKIAHVVPPPPPTAVRAPTPPPPAAVQVPVDLLARFRRPCKARGVAKASAVPVTTAAAATSDLDAIFPPFNPTNYEDVLNAFRAKGHSISKELEALAIKDLKDSKGVPFNQLYLDGVIDWRIHGMETFKMEYLKQIVIAMRISILHKRIIPPKNLPERMAAADWLILHSSM